MAAMTDPADGAEPALSEARDALRVERRRVVDEREAFEAFRARVRRVPTATASATQPPLRYGSASAGRGLVAVRDAYLETVMSVPHYDEEYDDTYERSLEAEFGPDLTLALTRESTLHGRYKRALLSKVETAIEERESFLEHVETEAASIDRATATLSPIVEEIETISRSSFSADDFGTLDAYRARTHVLEENCDGVANRRQREIGDAERSLRTDDSLPDLPTYLYQELPVTYPVLSAVGTVGDRIESLRRDVERAMIQ